MVGQQVYTLGDCSWLPELALRGLLLSVLDVTRGQPTTHSCRLCSFASRLSLACLYLAQVTTLIVGHLQVTKITNRAHSNPNADTTGFLIKSHIVYDETRLWIVTNEELDCLVFND